mgnify:CR=1 FL=1
MRKYLSYLLCMLAAASLAGCRGIGVEPDDIPADARLQLRSTELVATRTAGVQDLNENLISQVQLFFSDNGEDILYRTEVEVNEADGIVEDLPLTLPVAAMESLFSADNTCQLFVVANAPAIPEDVNTVSGVKAESITLAKQVAALSKDINAEDSIDKTVIQRINMLQENTMVLRENIFDRQRILSNILRSERFPNDIYPRLQLMIKDVNSLINHADFSFQRLDYIQDSALGLINIEQNEIVKIFSVAAVIFLPATLVASIYGMNFQVMPELNWVWEVGGYTIPLGYIFAICLMVIFSGCTMLYFRYKKWL